MSFHTTITKVENGAVYDGYNIRYIEKSAPEVFKFQPSARFAADGSGTVVLEVIAKTPAENFAKVFTLNSNVAFDYDPIEGLKIEIKITNFQHNEKYIKFEFFIKGCCEFPFKIGEQCVEKTFSVELPKPLALAEQETHKMSSGDLALLLITEQYQNCNCN
ncbi:MAG: hypothetical protein AAF617_11425 [Bacteroidota bacterium]